MEQSFTLGVYIPTSEQPPRHVVLADTGELPTIEFTPGHHETCETTIDKLTRHVLRRLVGVSACHGRQENGVLLYRTKEVNPTTVQLHEGYDFSY